MKKLSDFKALLFDIDRTLTDTKREISPETIAVLDELNKKGFQIGVCSGRGVASIKNKILPFFPKNSYHITTGGSQLVNSKGKVVWEHPIDAETIKKFREYIESSEFEGNKPVVIFMKGDAQYAEEPIFTNLKKHPWNVIAKNLNEMSNDRVGSVYISNLNNRIIDYIENNPNLSFKSMIGNSGNPYIDVTAKGINKSQTLEKWSEHTGILTEKIIGFGDSLNDMEFLKGCGFSVAMGNAVEEIKQIADRTIGHVDDNSLAKYLTEIIKGGNL